jgi:hypothetical protein
LCSVAKEKVPKEATLQTSLVGVFGKQQTFDVYAKPERFQIDDEYLRKRKTVVNSIIFDQCVLAKMVSLIPENESYSFFPMLLCSMSYIRIVIIGTNFYVLYSAI